MNPQPSNTPSSARPTTARPPHSRRRIPPGPCLKRTAQAQRRNHKKVQRLWREEGLRVPQRRRRKRIGTSTTANTPVADGLNRLWAVV
jgi:hypothetical protein